MENMGTLMLLGIVLLMTIAITWGIYHVKQHHQKLMEYYDNIKIGDRYSFTSEPTHPFDKKRTHIVMIINKKLDDGKYPWVQYRDQNDNVSQDKLHDFLSNCKKIGV